MAKQTEVATHLNVTTRRVRDWHKLPGFPVPKGAGGYDLDKVRFWYIDYLKNSANKESSEPIDDDEETFARDKARLILREKAVNIEIKETNLLILQKKWGPLDLIEVFCSRLSSSMVSIFDASLGKLKQEHPDIPLEYIDTFKRELADVRNALANAEPDFDDFIESDEEEIEAGINGP